jgi:uncharacterized protein (DUF58 family)
VKKTAAVFLACAGTSFLAYIVLMSWSIANPPEDIFSGLTLAVWTAVAFWAGRLFFAIAAGLAVVHFILARFCRKERCSKTASDGLAIEHLFTIEHLP